MRVLVYSPWSDERKAVKTALVDTGFCKGSDILYLGSDYKSITAVIKGADLIVISRCDKMLDDFVDRITAASHQCHIPVLEGSTVDLIRMLHRSDEDR